MDAYTTHEEFTAKLKVYHRKRTIFLAAMLASGLPMLALVIMAPAHPYMAWAVLPLALLFSISAGFYSHYAGRVVGVLWEKQQQLFQEGTEKD